MKQMITAFLIGLLVFSICIGFVVFMFYFDIVIYFCYLVGIICIIASIYLTGDLILILINDLKRRNKI